MGRNNSLQVSEVDGVGLPSHLKREFSTRHCITYGSRYTGGGWQASGLTVGKTTEMFGDRPHWRRERPVPTSKAASATRVRMKAQWL